jgi:hypothetical protein
LAADAPWRIQQARSRRLCVGRILRKWRGCSWLDRKHEYERELKIEAEKEKRKRKEKSKILVLGP